MFIHRCSTGSTGIAPGNFGIFSGIFPFYYNFGILPSFNSNPDLTLGEIMASLSCICDRIRAADSHRVSEEVVRYPPRHKPSSQPIFHGKPELKQRVRYGVIKVASANSHIPVDFLP